MKISIILLIANIYLILIGNAGYAAIDYHSTFDRAKKSVEIEVKQKLNVQLNIRTIQKLELGEHYDNTALSSPIALYDRRKRVVVLDSDRLQVFFIKAKNTKDISDLLFLTLVHELIHAYQDTILTSHLAPIINGRWLRFICEGHALNFSEIICKKNNIPEEIASSYSRQHAYSFESDSLLRRSQLLTNFFYSTSSKYVESQCTKITDFLLLIQTPLSYPHVLKSIETPRRLKVDQAEIDSNYTGRNLIQSKKSSVELIQSAYEGINNTTHSRYKVGKPLPLDYLESIAYVCPVAFSDLAVASSFLDSAITEISYGQNSTIEVVVLRFDTQNVAKNLWGTIKSYHNLNGQSSPDSTSFDIASTNICTDYMQSAAHNNVTLLIRRENFVAIFNYVNDGDNSVIAQHIVKNMSVYQEPSNE